jgi:hypothetical protein
MNFGTVYKIFHSKFPEQILYIGSTKMLLRKRFQAHRHMAIFHPSRLYTYMRQNGIENFNIQPIKSYFGTKFELQKMEEFYRMKYNPPLNSRRCCVGLDPASPNYHKDRSRQYYKNNKNRKHAYYVKNRQHILERMKRKRNLWKPSIL